MQAGVDPIIRRLAMARCDRAASCNEIGDSRGYATHEECVGEMTARIASGDHICLVDERKEGLEHCLAEISSQPCVELDPGSCPETLSASELQNCLRWQTPN
jgi:hypothetical protein